MFIPSNANIIRLTADVGNGGRDINLTNTLEEFVNYSGALGYYISYYGEFDSDPDYNYSYSGQVTISVTTQTNKVYNYRITKGELISSAGRYSKYKAIQTKI